MLGGLASSDMVEDVKFMFQESEGEIGHEGRTHVYKSIVVLRARGLEQPYIPDLTRQNEQSVRARF